MANTITLRLTTETQLALLKEALDKQISVEGHINQILVLRFADPTWPDLAETAMYAALWRDSEGVAERAIASAVRHEADAFEVRAMVREAIASGAVIASPGFLIQFERHATGLGGEAL